jgi:hypothetical protein
MRHDLCKDESARVHWRRPQYGWKNPECYERRSNRDQLQTRNILNPSTCYMTPA